jgi:hypothetical protein
MKSTVTVRYIRAECADLMLNRTVDDGISLGGRCTLIRSTSNESLVSGDRNGHMKFSSRIETSQKLMRFVA